MGYRGTDPAAATNAFARQVQLGANMRSADQDEEMRAGQIAQGNALAKLRADPNATPEQFIRAGATDQGNSLANMQANDQAQKAAAFPRIGQIATQLTSIADPVQKRAAFKQAILANGSLFDTMGMPHTDALAKVDTTDDATLDATLQSLAKFAAPAPLEKVSAGDSLVRADRQGNVTTAYTAPNKPTEGGGSFAKINPSEYTRASVEKFQTSQKFSDLIPLAKPTGDQGFNRANSLRDEYNKQSQTFQGVADSYQRILDSAKDPSPAGDLSLIFNYMKVLDPGSTVREGEFATAAQAGSIDSRIVGLYNRVINGERLAADQRSDFVKRSTGLYRGQEARHKSNVVDRYNGLAKRYGVDPQDVTGNVDAKVPTEALPPTNAKGWTLHTDAKGARAYVSPDGAQFEEVP